ncbi:APC family permease [Streptomyces virginiae]|uniref:APC family permease n=1 Tax=Streptomyces virginiae TaxID=1961 RepID=UPI00068BFA0D|nr:APC family permease [Streptomyces virginiae]
MAIHVGKPTAVAQEPGQEEPPDTSATGAGDRHRLTALQGLAALSLDAMASVAYGPESIVLVLAAAGAYGMGFTLPVTLAIAALLAVLVASYRQVIAAFPDGGGSYAVAERYLGRRAGLVAAASLILDYVLNVAVSVTAGVAALTSAFPGLHGERVWICLAVLLLVTAVNLRGVVDSAKAFLVPTALFVGSILAMISVGLFRDGPVSTASAAGHASALGEGATAVGALLLMKAFAAGCSALTGVEAVTHPTVEDRRTAEALRRDWELWKPGVDLIEISSETRSLGRPVAAYVRTLARTQPDAQVTVLIPETEPARLWQRLLQNQRGSVVAHAVRRDTDAVICRLRFRIVAKAEPPLLDAPFTRS